MKINSNTIQVNRGDAEFAELERVLSKIAEENGIDSVEMLHVALSQESGVVRFKSSADLNPTADPTKTEQTTGIPGQAGGTLAPTGESGGQLGTSQSGEGTQPVEQSPEEKAKIEEELKKREQMMAEQQKSAEQMVDELDTDLSALDAEFASKKQQGQNV